MYICVLYTFDFIEDSSQLCTMWGVGDKCAMYVGVDLGSILASAVFIVL